MDLINKFVLGMAMLRFLSGSIEIFAGLLMIRFNEVSKALIINSSLAIVGPLILIFTTTIGLVGLSNALSFSKIAFILTGVLFILIGVTK